MIGQRGGMLTRQDLLGEVDLILRETPQYDEIGRGADAVFEWTGRAAAAIERWDGTRFPTVSTATTDIHSLDMNRNVKGLNALKALLNQARADLRMEVGQLSAVIPRGGVFEYFDELRKVIEEARTELFFVDAYLDAEFVPRYLPHAAKGIPVRLLGGPAKMPTLLPAIDLFGQQFGTRIQVRSSPNLHERYLFVDRSACYLSGASFKDGAKKAPAVLTQVIDAFQPMWDTYEAQWNSGKMER